jgi:FKBP12-rapamycin complex-associated protein
MEVTGIDGNYRLTCERVLRLLRNNNESILAVLEAFVYDPVLNWRPTEVAKKPPLDQLNTAAPTHFHLPMGEPNRSESEAINRIKAKLCGELFSTSFNLSNRSI